MKWKKSLLSLFCAFLLATAVVFPALGSGSAPSVYILAVNDKVCDLPGRVLPLALNGTVYVPYTAFDKLSTGVDIGVYHGLDPTEGTTLTLYSMNKILVFKVTQATCEDGQGNQMYFHAVKRYGIPYVPISAVCSYFGLTYAFLPTADRGTLVRISNGSARMSDSEFLAAAAPIMLNRYHDALSRMDPTISFSPANSPAPVHTLTPSGNPDRPPVYLAVDASDLDADLSEVFQDGVYALLLYRPDSLAQHSRQVRKAIAAGNMIGLIVDGAYEEALEQLKRGNDLLTHIARVRTHTVWTSESLAAELKKDGWTCWESDVTGATVNELSNALERRRTATYVMLPSDESILRRAISKLQNDEYPIYMPLETVLN